MPVPLAAKPYSSVLSGGKVDCPTLLQVSPPSVVFSRYNLSSMGSLISIPLLSFQKSKPSKKASGSALIYVVFQECPSSVDLYIRDWSPLPMLMSKMVWSPVNSMSRKSSESAPGTSTFCQEAPPSTVFKTVPPVPQTQAL